MRRSDSTTAIRSQVLSMRDRNRAVLAAWASRSVSPRRIPATSRVLVASAMAGFPIRPKLPKKRMVAPMAAPKAGKAKPATLSVPGFLTLAGSTQTPRASSVSETGHAAPQLM